MCGVGNKQDGQALFGVQHQEEGMQEILKTADNVGTPN